MNATGVIVVGVDGSESSIDALRWAAAQAELAHATLTVVSAWSLPTAWGREPTYPPGWDPEEETQKRLADVVESVLGAHYEFEVHQVVVEGHAGPALIAAAEHADLLVVGSRGHGAFAGIMLGSVSLYCVTQAPCPVVVAHSRPPA